MNLLEKEYFEEIRNIAQRAMEASYRMPQFRGMFEIIQNLYKDKAHFVYELLQNADDQGAVNSKFILRKDGLIFMHDAPKHFTITNPATHKEDFEAGRLGDINSIVSIGSSTKIGQPEQVKIGKFGVGFKSVFQYTTRPEIYDDNVSFFIEDYIIPGLLNDDHPERLRGQTLFYFPFNKANKSVACLEISDAILRLANVRPLLFLNHLSSIKWQTDEETGVYELKVAGPVGSGKKLIYTNKVGDSVDKEVYWRFDRPLVDRSQLKVSVVFNIDEEEHCIITDAKYNLYCYMQTSDASNLPVILHAPFRLSNNRESIEAKDTHNDSMVKLLASLLSDSLKEICEIGEKEGCAWINDNIIDFMPDLCSISSQNAVAGIDITPIVEEVIKSIKNGKMLWCNQLKKYLDITSAVNPDADYFPELYPSGTLYDLLGRECGWVLCDINKRYKDDKRIINVLGVESVSNKKIIDSISKEYLSNRSFDWLIEWYKSLLKVNKLWRELKFKDILLTSDGSFQSPFISGKTDANVHLPDSDWVIPDGIDNVYFVDRRLIYDEDVLSFLKGIGLNRVDALTMTEKVYLPMAKDRRRTIASRLKSLLNFRDLYMGELAGHKTIFTDEKMCPVIIDNTLTLLSHSQIKVHNEINDFYFHGNPNVVFFEPEALIPWLSEKETKLIYTLVNDSDKPKSPSILKAPSIPLTNANNYRLPKGCGRAAWSNQYKADYEYFIEYQIEGLETFCDLVAPSDPIKSSAVILSCIKKINQLGGCKFGYWKNGYEHTVQVEPLLYEKLRQTAWINNASNDLKRELGIEVDDIDSSDLERVGTLLASAGLVTPDKVSALLDYMIREGVVEEYQLKKDLEEQRDKIKEISDCSLNWLEAILDLRQKYMDAGEKNDIPVLINRLKDSIHCLKENTYFDENADLRSFLPDNINVVFGPPGTGKTTYIARCVADAMAHVPNVQILILTPTHHAANVVALKIKDTGVDVFRALNTNSSENERYVKEAEDFGLEVSNGCRDEGPNVIACTVHYFSDTFTDTHAHCWDMIIIDEASMVTLDYALLALFNGQQFNPDCKFIIAGDPLQLPAITSLDSFILEIADMDEFNFFSFIGLKTFSDDVSNLNEAVKDKITISLLHKQYRSVASLARLTGKFAYDDQIIPLRDDKMRFIAPDGALPIFKHPLSFLRFPISDKTYGFNGDATPREPDIIDLDKLKGSNFNIYSALLVVESLQHLFNLYQGKSAEDCGLKELKVGIITPYVGQKQLIAKLADQLKLARPTWISVDVNTVHQFQGDEFDIVVLVLNPPNKSMKPADKILINKFYLMNVATSRAKDCLVVLYPDKTCKEENFLFVNKQGIKNNLEQLASEIYNCTLDELTYYAKDLEEMMFGSQTYLISKSKVTHREDVNIHKPNSNYKYYFNIGGNSIDIIVTDS
ncbi:DEAD/DEAH box helicase family protein [Bacteroides acidifaciens]|jgi:hypothetical protein|uniref:DEAD/DEAH box helicase family protein n=1 Tax=Bacteroides acidifaciens TaxID=85831 RepID=UPI002599566A|nr:DEAD/DEAH box helicase [Bacteroides acidifaciens]